MKIVALGTKNPYSKGTKVYVDAVQWSAAQGEAGLGEASGPADAQRVIFGYTNRKDYVDSQGHAWRPAAEYIMRLSRFGRPGADRLWTEPKVNDVAEHQGCGAISLRRSRERFHGLLHRRSETDVSRADQALPSRRSRRPGKLATSIDIQGKTVAADVDIAATAGGLGKAVDLVFNDIKPKNGVIAIRFWNRFSGEAMVQAIEIGPDRSEPGVKPVQAAVPPTDK